MYWAYRDCDRGAKTLAEIHSLKPGCPHYVNTLHAEFIPKQGRNFFNLLFSFLDLKFTMLIILM